LVQQIIALNSLRAARCTPDRLQPIAVTVHLIEMANMCIGTAHFVHCHRNSCQLKAGAGAGVDHHATKEKAGIVG
jgi:hypothetical protein